MSFMDKHNIDFCTHGDDMPKTTTGVGVFDESIAAGRFRMIQRTEGTSTTKLIETLLTKDIEPFIEATHSELLNAFSNISPM